MQQSFQNKATTLLIIVLFVFGFVGSTQNTPQSEFEIVVKKAFSGSISLQSGPQLEFKLGYETMGNLNHQKTNAILICHYFTGTSHFAGKYSSADNEPGYWDSLIGPGKYIDTNKYFVFSVDSLSNSQVHNPFVITTGPASINPSTGKEWGLDFPVVTIRDFVNTQKILLDQLGIKTLHAVMGASMGSYQALEWAATYPEIVSRAIAVVPGGIANAWHIGTLHLWAQPILLDPNFNNGRYYDTEKSPLQGIALTLKTISFNAVEPVFFEQSHGVEWANSSQNPLYSIFNEYAVEEWLNRVSNTRALLMDANSILYLVKACQMFTIGNPIASKSSHIPDTHILETSHFPPILLIPSTNDRIIEPTVALEVHKKLRSASTMMWVDGTKYGHLTFVSAFSHALPHISEFIDAGIVPLSTPLPDPSNPHNDL